MIAFIHSQNILYPDPAPSPSPEKNSTKGTLLPCRVFEQEFEQHLEPNEFPLPVAQGSGAQKRLFPPWGSSWLWKEPGSGYAELPLPEGEGWRRTVLHCSTKSLRNWLISAPHST